MIVSAMLSVERVFYTCAMAVSMMTSTPSRHEHSLQRRQRRLMSDLGDHFTYLNVFKKFLSHGQSREWCEDHGVHFRSLRTALSIYEQLKEVLSKNRVTVGPPAEDVLAALQEVLVQGCTLNLARRCANDYYRTLIDIHENGGTRLGEVHPSSALAVLENYPPYLVFQEVGVGVGGEA